MTKFEENFEYAINLAAFILGIMNYSENLTQNDKQEIMQNLNDASDAILSKIEQHLEVQDQKLDKIIELLNKL